MPMHAPHRNAALEAALWALGPLLAPFLALFLATGRRMRRSGRWAIQEGTDLAAAWRADSALRRLTFAVVLICALWALMLAVTG